MCLDDFWFDVGTLYGIIAVLDGTPSADCDSVAITYQFIATCIVVVLINNSSTLVQMLSRTGG
jgi:hypothetical protein